MRRKLAILISAALALGGLSGSARAQTYDRNYPVCMQLSEWGGSRVECSYTSMAQCAATAAGLAGTCVPNPYFSFGRRDRRY